MLKFYMLHRMPSYIRKQYLVVVKPRKTKLVYSPLGIKKSKKKYALQHGYGNHKKKSVMFPAI
jgi:hypothetical protein